MSDDFKFFALRDIKDIRDCLEVYDDPEQIDHPPGSGVAFSEYFFPAAYKRGWRLLDEAVDIWKAFEYVKEEYHIPLNSELPMEFFTRTLKYVLKTYQTLENTTGLSFNVWQEGVMKSKYHKAVTYYVPLDKSDQ